MKRPPGWHRALEHMKTYGSISTVEGTHLYPAILRLSERIRECEQFGYTIRHERLPDHTMRYYLMSETPMAIKPKYTMPELEEIKKLIDNFPPPFKIEAKALVENNQQKLI